MSILDELKSTKKEDVGNKGSLRCRIEDCDENIVAVSGTVFYLIERKKIEKKKVVEKVWHIDLGDAIPRQLYKDENDKAYVRVYDINAEVVIESRNQYLPVGTAFLDKNHEDVKRLLEKIGEQAEIDKSWIDHWKKEERWRTSNKANG